MVIAMNQLAAPPHIGAPHPSITKGLGELRRYAHFIESSVDAFSHERSLRRRGIEFIYFVDFQEVYNYIAPFFLHPNEKRPTFLHRFFAARDLFENSTEPIYFPLGTLVEISSFVQKIKGRVQSLYRVTLAQDLDRATQEFVNFFRAERFLEPKAVSEFIESVGGGSPSAGLIRIQRDALALLSDFEAGASRLHALLTKGNVFDLSSVHQSVRLDRDFYRRIFDELKEIRRPRPWPRGAGDLSNSVDAFNISFAVALNDHFDNLKERRNGEGAPWRFSKIITDTRSFFTLRHKLDSQLTYKNYHGFDVPLFESCEDILHKRALGKLVASGRKQEVFKLATSARQAKNALIRLGFIADERGMSSEEVLQWLIEPSAARELSLLTEARDIVEELRDFSSEETSILGDVLRRSAREDLAVTPHLLNESVDRPYAPQSVIAVRSLLDSIESVVAKTERIGFELTQPQRSYEAGVWNPLLSIENLGYQRRLTESKDRTADLRATWTLTKTGEADPSFTLDVYSECAALSWPTSADLDVSLKAIIASLSLLDVSENRVTSLLLIDFRGHETLVPSPLDLTQLDLARPEFHEVAFFRIDFPKVAFTAELFSVDESYVLTSGVLVSLPLGEGELSFLLKAVGLLARSFVPENLLRDEMQCVLDTYVTTSNRAARRS
jgi:hypothetical protein